MYKIYVVFKCVPGKREGYIDKMKSEGIIDAVRNEDGCYRYDFYFSEKDADEILLIEEWESKEHQQIHLTQPHMKKLGDIKPDFVVSATLGEFETK